MTTGTMPCRLLPGTDLHLSVVGFGCWPMGSEHWGDDIDEGELTRAVHAALAAGITWFDVAPLYGDGLAETRLGRALKGRAALIATTVGAVRDAHVYSDPTPARVVADCEASLRRLQVEVIDLLQVHWPSERGTPIEETVGALHDLQRRGLIRHFGLCNDSPEGLRRARAAGPVASLQAPYSLLRREWEGELRDTCAALGVGLLAYETLCRGLLSGRYGVRHRFPDTDMRRHDPRFRGAWGQHALRLAADLGRAGEKVGVSAASIATGWVLAQPGVTAAIVGIKRPAQVAEAVQAAALLDRARLWSVVSRIAEVHGGFPAPPGEGGG